jgi:uncharacterized protein
MKFEYDQAKSAANLQKHGIDFEEAQELWRDDKLLEIRVTSQPELRYFALGEMKNKTWTAVYTYRNDVMRLISVRRSRKSEVELYENQD